MRLRLIGDSPLICHRFSEKAKKQMLDKQMKKATNAKAAKDPTQDFKDSLYHLPGGKHGFPAVAFKAAAVTACTSVGSIKKTAARQAFHVWGANGSQDMVVVEGKPTMREDTVKIGMGITDLRYRGEFRKWAAEIIVRYNSSFISPEQLVHLFNTAGFAVGVGEWRPERDGQFGMFHCDEKGVKA